MPLAPVLPATVPSSTYILPLPTPMLPVFSTTLAIFSAGISGLALYHALTWRIKPFIPLGLLKRISMKGRLWVKTVEVKSIDIATLLERLRDTASVERRDRPIAPLLDRLKRTVVWEQKPVKVPITKAGKVDIKRLEQIWRATKSRYSEKRSLQHDEN